MPTFDLYDAPSIATQDTRFDESLMQHAAINGPVACIWQTAQGLVVPRTYLRAASFENTCTDFAAQGWPITVRHSGGGVVPQGPGILNVSMAYTVEGPPLDHSDAAYLRLCEIMQHAISEFGIDAHPRAVLGSFCDGRFNLASGEGHNRQKIAGTAQLWRRQPKPDGERVQVVLVHGLLLVATDIHAVTERANALENALGNSRRYLTERARSLHTLMDQSPADTVEFVHEVINALRGAITRQ